MKRFLKIIVPAAVIMFLAGAAASTASATVTGNNPCSSNPTYGWYGDSVAVSADIPSLDSPGETYRGTILRPTDTAAYPGKRPVIVIQHGATAIAAPCGGTRSTWQVMATSSRSMPHQRTPM